MTEQQDDLFALSVPVFLRSLGILDTLLAAGERHATEARIDPATLLAAKLAPDMYALIPQIQIACDTAKRTAARLASTEAPSFEDNEASFAELHERIRKTITFIKSLPAGAFAGSGGRTIEFKLGPEPVKLSGLDYLIRFGLPNFYFHLVTAYDILRHAGVAVGKRDFLGNILAG